jgi:heme/copper-type cytochrome/quinol oxidase subunit 2
VNRKSRTTVPVRILVCALLLAVLLPVVLSACPLCKEEISDQSPSMWRGMFWSILLMVTMPFAVVGTVVLKVLHARRRQGGSPGARS